MPYVEVKAPYLLKNVSLPEDVPHWSAIKRLQEVLGAVDSQNTKEITHFKAEEYLRIYIISKQIVDHMWKSLYKSWRILCPHGTISEWNQRI
jgi:hypothetical protein